MFQARPWTLVFVAAALSGLGALESCSGGLDETTKSTTKKSTTGGTSTTGGSASTTNGATATTTGSANTTTGATATTTGSANTTTGATATTTGSANTTTGATATTTGSANTTTGATATTTSATTTTGTTATTTGTSATTTSATTTTSTSAGTTGGSSTSTGSCSDTKPATAVKATMAALTNFSAPDSAGAIIGSGVDKFGGFGTTWPYVAPVGNTYVYPAADRDDSIPDGGTTPSCALKAGATAPAHPLTSSLNICDKVPTPGTWTIKGTVGDYSGAGIALWCPVDASMFSGIQFDIGGTFTPFTTVTFTVTTATDTTLATTTTAQYTATVSSTVTTVSVPWSQFTSGDGGASGLNNKLITGIGWGLGWYYPADAGAPYTVNFTIDNVAWLP